MPFRLCQTGPVRVRSSGLQANRQFVRPFRAGFGPGRLTSQQAQQAPDFCPCFASGPGFRSSDRTALSALRPRPVSAGPEPGWLFFSSNQSDLSTSRRLLRAVRRCTGLGQARATDRQAEPGCQAGPLGQTGSGTQAGQLEQDLSQARAPGRANRSALVRSSGLAFGSGSGHRQATAQARLPDQARQGQAVRSTGQTCQQAYPCPGPVTHFWPTTSPGPRLVAAAPPRPAPGPVPRLTTVRAQTGSGLQARLSDVRPSGPGPFQVNSQVRLAHQVRVRRAVDRPTGWPGQATRPPGRQTVRQGQRVRSGSGPGLCPTSRDRSSGFRPGQAQVQPDHGCCPDRLQARPRHRTRPG